MKRLKLGFLLEWEEYLPQLGKSCSVLGCNVVSNCWASEAEETYSGRKGQVEEEEEQRGEP